MAAQWLTSPAPSQNSLSSPYINNTDNDNDVDNDDDDDGDTSSRWSVSPGPPSPRSDVTSQRPMSPSEATYNEDYVATHSCLQQVSRDVNKLKQKNHY